MSLLAPLYLLGALAVIGPIIVHLIRRQPKGEVEFSSLMFLDPTPPRLTRRSRLENLPLLLLRCGVIVALAFAFARPFLPASQSTSVNGATKAMVLLVDQSASMQRAGLREQAVAKAKALIDQTDSDTLISVVAFDASPKTVLSLRQSAELTGEARKRAARDATAQISPTWFPTDLGKAIRYAADQASLLDLGGGVQDAAEPSAASGASLETQIVLLSDLQSGAPIESLQGYSWPQRVWLDIQPVQPKSVGNASLRVIPQPVSVEPPNGTGQQSARPLRVAVTRTADGGESTFRLRMAGSSEELAVVQVPPGGSRIVTVALAETAASDAADKRNRDDTAALTLIGDQDDFDNTYYFVRPRRAEQSVWYIGAPTDETEGAVPDRETLDFYAAQVPWSDSTREVTFQTVDPRRLSEPVDAATVPLMIVRASPLVGQLAEALQSYLATGGRVLMVADGAMDPLTGRALAGLLDSPDLDVSPANGEGEYRLIAAVDFKSPLIRPLAEPGVNDFSNIRVWDHRVFNGYGKRVSVTLKLDDGTPLLMRRDVSDGDSETPDGKLWVLASGWQPSQSQFALSTKFVPLMLGMLGPNRQLVPDSIFVGESYDGEQVGNEPGFVTDGDGNRLAVNLNPSESDTVPIDLDRFSEYGAVVSTPQMRAQDASAERALRDVELEARQGWWQWLILATLGLIAAETLLAAKQSPPNEAPQ